MELTNEFEVPVPVEEAWAVLTDLERIAPAMPGAELQEVEGDEYRGIVKVKVGPITASYRGAARFEELDTESHRAVLKADGRETRGQGNASATITASLSPSGDGTKVTVVSEIAITGKVAQFGRGVLADVSGKLLDQFVRNLETTVLTPGAQTPAAGDDSHAGESTSTGPTATGPTATGDVPKPPLTRAAKNAAARAAKSAAEAAEAASSHASEAGTPEADIETTDEGGPGDSFGSGSAGDGSSSSAGEASSSGNGSPAADNGSPADNGSAAGVGSAGLAAGGEHEADPASGGGRSEEPNSGGIRRIESAPAEPVDLVGVAGSSIAKRMVPFASVAGILVLIRIVIYAMKRRKS